MSEEEEMTDTKYNKQKIRAKLEIDVRKYLARGGKIRQMPFGAITEGIDISDVFYETRLEQIQILIDRRKNRELVVKDINEKE
jgi:hypothetical protein